MRLQPYTRIDYVRRRKERMNAKRESGQRKPAQMEMERELPKLPDPPPKRIQKAYLHDILAALIIVGLAFVAALVLASMPTGA